MAPWRLLERLFPPREGLDLSDPSRANRDLTARTTVLAIQSGEPGPNLGGGIGLLASAHLLAAAGGDGMLEIDANPNELRSLMCGAVATVRDGWVTLNEAPGLGIAPDLAALERFRVAP